MMEQNPSGGDSQGKEEHGSSSSAKAKTSALSIWSLVCGILGLIVFPFSIPAMIVGIIGILRINKSAGMLKGLGLAIAGIILGFLSFIAWLLIFLLLIIPTVGKYRDRAMDSLAKVQINQIATSLETYYLDTGAYPANEQGLTVLVKSEKGNSYLDKLPNDPWGRPYHYRMPGTLNPDSFDLWSDGRDNIEGTTDDIIRPRNGN
jgi:general secretion pathway protein G